MRRLGFVWPKMLRAIALELGFVWPSVVSFMSKHCFHYGFAVGFVCGSWLRLRKCQRRIAHPNQASLQWRRDRRHNNLLSSHAKNKARRSRPHRALITVLKDALLCMSSRFICKENLFRVFEVRTYRRIAQPRPEERACARLEGRPQARSCQRPSFETLGAHAARRAPQDEVGGFKLHHSIRLVSWKSIYSEPDSVMRDSPVRDQDFVVARARTMSHPVALASLSRLWAVQMSAHRL